MGVSKKRLNETIGAMEVSKQRLKETMGTMGA